MDVQYVILSLTIIISILTGMRYNNSYLVGGNHLLLGARTNRYFVIIIDAGGIVVINPEQNNTLICPGESFHYSCHVSGNFSITWSVQSPGEKPITFSLRHGQTENNYNGSLNCNFNSNMFDLEIYLTYTTTQRGAHSNITIGVPSLNYFVITAQSVKIGCEDSIYRYVEVPGMYI